MREDQVIQFFEDLEKENQSIEEIEMTMFNGEIKKVDDPQYAAETEFFESEVAQFGESILRCLRKKHLKRFSVNFQVIQPCDNVTESFDSTVVANIVQVFQVITFL